MKQPFIMYEGEKYPVLSIDWYEDGNVCHVTFKDSKRVHRSAFKKESWNVEGFDEHGILHLDLEKAMIPND